MSFNYTKFLKEGGIEKNLQEAGDFGNDPQDRYNYARKFTADLPDTARTEQMIQNLEDALEDYKMTDEVGEFDQAFVEIMIALGKENELMEGESLINPEAEEISPEDLEAASDLLASLAENDDVLDEMLDEAPMVVDDFEVGDKVALNVAYQKAGGDERMIDSEFKFRVVGVREVPKGGGGTYQDVSVERMSDGERVSYANSQLARIEDIEWFAELEGEVQSEEIEEGVIGQTFRKIFGKQEYKEGDIVFLKKNHREVRVILQAKRGDKSKRNRLDYRTQDEKYNLADPEGNIHYIMSEPQPINVKLTIDNAGIDFEKLDSLSKTGYREGGEKIYQTSIKGEAVWDEGKKRYVPK